MDWFKYIDEQEIIEWRRWFHQHPELGRQEYKTSEYIETELKKMNIEVIRPTPTSVLGIIKGENQGKNIGLRADIDALPIEEETGLPFRSQNKGVMHACGHDAHAAMLLGAAKVLSQIKSIIHGEIKLIFQHSEESNPGGAKEIIATGALDDIDYYYGSHILTPIKAGEIQILSGPIMAAQDLFRLNIYGKASHGSIPEKAIDPITIGSQIVISVNQIVSKNLSPFDNVAISFGRFKSGNVFNVIPGEAFLEGSIRTYSKESRKYVKKRFFDTIDYICKLHGAKYEIEYIDGYPLLVNDVSCANLAKKTGEELFGEGVCVEGSRSMISEDFSYYLEKAPGVYAFIGGGNEAENCKYVNHHPKFNIVESSMINGVKMYVGFALNASKTK